MNFSYVDVTTKGYEGCLNLFYMGYPIALVTDTFLADKLRQEIPKYGEPYTPVSKSYGPIKYGGFYVCSKCRKPVANGKVCGCESPSV